MAPQKRLFGECNSEVGSSTTIESIMVRLCKPKSMGVCNSVVEKKARVMRRRYGDDRKEDKGVPRACDCSAAVLVQTSDDPTVKGMQFICCPYEISEGRGQGCGFRRLWDQAIIDEFEKIRQDNATLTKALDAANEKIEELEIRVSASEDDGSLEQAVVDANGKVDLLTEKYEDLAAKFEWIEAKCEKLNKYL